MRKVTFIGGAICVGKNSLLAQQAIDFLLRNPGQKVLFITTTGEIEVTYNPPFQLPEPPEPIWEK